MSGLRGAPPAAAWAMPSTTSAGLAPFRRYPLAPARRAAKTRSGSSWTVKTTKAVLRRWGEISRIHSTPRGPGQLEIDDDHVGLFLEDGLHRLLGRSPGSDKGELLSSPLDQLR